MRIWLLSHQICTQMANPRLSGGRSHRGRDVVLLSGDLHGMAVVCAPAKVVIVAI